MKKVVVLVAVVLLMGLSVSALGAGTIKIGALMSLTGSLGPYGPPIVNGAKLAVEQINAAGGILGHPLKLIVMDTATNPDVGRDAARKLIELDQVPAIVGALSSNVTLAAASVTIPAEVVLISPASSAVPITKLSDNDYVFRTVVSDKAQGTVFARLAVLLNYHKVSIIYVNNPYGKGLADIFKETFESYGGKVLAAVPYEAGKPSYRGEVNKLLIGNPDAIVMICYPKEGNEQIDEIVSAGYKGPFLFSDGMKGAPVAPGRACPSADNPGPIEGSYGTVASGGLTGSGTEQFDADYVKEFGPSSVPYNYQAYDAVMVIALAVAKALADDPNTKITGTVIRDNLRAVSNPPGEKVYYGEFAKAISLLKAGKSINYEGVSGVVDFSANGDVTGDVTGTAQILIWKIQGCQVTPVMTVPAKTT